MKSLLSSVPMLAWVALALPAIVISCNVVRAVVLEVIRAVVPAVIHALYH